MVRQREIKEEIGREIERPRGRNARIYPTTFCQVIG
jgi:hypothetical protein